jgi:hypothetical protein
MRQGRQQHMSGKTQGRQLEWRHGRRLVQLPSHPPSPAGTHGGTLDQSFEETRAGRLPGTKRARKRLTQGSFLFPSAPPLGLDSRRRSTQQFLHRICGHFRAIGTHFGKVDQGAA